VPQLSIGKHEQLDPKSLICFLPVVPALATATAIPFPPMFDRMTFEEFLADRPLNSEACIKDGLSTGRQVAWPDYYRDYCSECDGERRHNRIKCGIFEGGYHFATYRCVDCDENSKRDFGLFLTHADPVEGPDAVIAKKVFQKPDFGTPIPKNLFDLIGEDNRQHFLNARRSVARGLGIGAYTYYRRIIENNKLALVDSVLKVARKVGSSAEQVVHLEAAAKERQFSKAIGMLRDIQAIPAVLQIGGHNPLLLLHDELSEGVHAMTDEGCLVRAQHAEVILFELARLMKIAIAERKEVAGAIDAIMNRKKP
jgi:hypothetical protein